MRIMDSGIRASSTMLTQGRVVSDEDIWRSFQSGEDAAFNMLYARYGDRIYGYLRMLLTSSPALLDDIFQETWILVFKNRQRFDSNGPGSFAGWLFKVAHNAAISEVRKVHHTTSIEELTIDSELIEGFVVEAKQENFGDPTTEELMVHVVQTVEELPLLLREVFVLSEFDRLTLDQIADTLGITRANARVRLFRARRMIRERLTKVLELS
jgi:RNA polymerase sigma-70 factor (ECF subfamily)